MKILNLIINTCSECPYFIGYFEPDHYHFNLCDNFTTLDFEYINAYTDIHPICDLKDYKNEQ